LVEPKNTSTAAFIQMEINPIALLKQGSHCVISPFWAFLYWMQ